MQQVAPGVFFESCYLGGNVGCVVTDEGPILIDTPVLPRDARHWRDQIALLSDRPILYVINTDYDPKHMLTNALFDAPVVAHETTWEYVRTHTDSLWPPIVEWLEGIDPAAAAEIKELGLVPPQITFTERMSLEKGSPAVRLIHLGGYTPATLAVYIPHLKVLFSGDNVVLDTLPLLAQADTKQWLQALTVMRKLSVETLVPGHGLVCDLAATEQLSEYIRLLRERVRRHFQANRTKSEMSGLLAGLLDAYPVADNEREGLRLRIKANLDRVFDEVKAQQRKK
ncbi:MAG: MBL fold metallo-hydrolase [Chloroflexota bacterium]